MRATPLLTASMVALGLAVTGLATPAFAQARAMGTVRDLANKPIKGATVKAVNPDAAPSEFASATDDKGRWAMIGLRSGTWRFIVEAPGLPLRGEVAMSPHAEDAEGDVSDAIAMPADARGSIWWLIGAAALIALGLVWVLLRGA
jgi:hypothetical protein